MRAEQFARLGVEHGFHEPLGLTERDRLAVADEREFADPNLVPGFPGARFGQPDRRDLRMAIGTARNVGRVERMGMKIGLAQFDRDHFGGGHPLVARLVRKPWRSRHVADRPQARDVGSAIRVDGDAPAFGRDAERLEPDILDIVNDPDRHDHMAEPMLAAFAVTGLDRRRHARCIGRKRLDPGPGQDRHPLLLEALAKRRRDFLVFARHDPVEHLNDGHLCTQVIIEAGKLDPDRPRSDHQQFARHRVGHHRMAIGPHALAIRLGKWKIASPRPGGDDDVLCGQYGRRLF